ncbi:MAG: TetR/AcrR family transcriptional regulator [Bacteroidales bacterium]|nr:TetR/AcrR family transcriptional regulator [Bacteroidales bacterium]MBS3774347.1 TetR/AcrR family transcriptional regulator [Bacteroidales bacterium]
MTEKIENTEERILHAAKQVFLKKGMAGARMQEIANEAGINKSLLHYYYRSKDKLFLAVFRLAIRDFIPEIKSIIFSGTLITEKIERFVEEYMNVLLNNPFVPLFILQEIQREPDRLLNIFLEEGIHPQLVLEQFEKAIQNEEIRAIDPKHLLINILSLCIFPFAARPMMQRMLFENDSEAYKEFLNERKKIVSEFVKNAIKK